MSHAVLVWHSSTVTKHFAHGTSKTLNQGNRLKKLVSGLADHSELQVKADYSK